MQPATQPAHPSNPFSTKMRCCSFFVVLILLVLAFLGGFVLRGGVPTSLPSVAAVATQISRIAKNAGAAAAPAATPSAPPRGSTAPVIQQNGREVTVQLDEAALTQRANATLAGQPVGDTPFGPATVRTLAVHLRNGEIVTDGTAQVGPTVAPVNVVSTARAESGRLRVAVTDATVGGVPLPASIRQQIETTLQAEVDQLLGRQPIQVRTVTIADGRLVATGTVA